MTDNMQAPVISGRRTPYPPAAAPAATEPIEDSQPGPPDTDRSSANPISQWMHDMRGDMTARKQRARGWWAMRWMREQPTSVADHVDYLLHQRHQRADGRRGWGLRTEAAAIDGTHAALYRLYGLTVGLVFTLACYALAWMAQRPGRFLLLAVGVWLAAWNLDTWLNAN